MLLTTSVLIKWSKNNKNYYINKGYIFTKYGDEFEVKTEDLSKGNSKVYVDVLCDYCLVNTVNKTYQDYIIQNEKAIIHKDCCKDCQSLKVKESNLLKYNVGSTFQVKEIHQKCINTLVNKYGVENPFQSEEIKDKIKQTCLDKYGVENYAQTEEWKERVSNTNLDKYGVEWVAQNNEIRQKQINTNIIRYGNECPLINESVNDKKFNTMLENYNVLFPIQNKDIKNQIIETNIKRYGFDNPMKNIDVKQKMYDTCMDKFGFSCSLLNEEVKEKRNKTWGKYIGGHPFKDQSVIDKSRKTMYENGTSNTSNQQIYLCNLLKGKLNYSISRCSVDLGFPEDNIYLEYNGGGHNLSVKFNVLTQNDFDIKELKRDIFLKSKGWKKICIISSKDYLPQDEVILQMIQFAKEYINENHSWITFDIDNELIECSQFKIKCDFGILRKIKNNININYKQYVSL